MAIGDSGKAVQNSIPGSGPMAAADKIGAHVHKGSPESTVGGPGETAQANKRATPGDPDNDGM